MRLANDEINITLPFPGVTLTLRASLRAAFNLAHSYCGFEPLFQAIREGNLTAISDLITMTCVNRSEWADYARNEDPDMIPALMAAREQLLGFIPVLCGADDKSDDMPDTGEVISFEDAFTNLYKVGTGWLKWPPEVVWNATIAEIMNARDGYLELMALRNGKSADTETIDATKGMPAELRKEINAIGKGR
ncbi:hypothetical protein ACVWWG_007208 [Bradyrhizobium sp. LB7.2]